MSKRVPKKVLLKWLDEVLCDEVEIDIRGYCDVNFIMSGGSYFPQQRYEDNRDEITITTRGGLHL